MSAVIALIAIQAALLFLSLDAMMEISVFCAAAKEFPLSWFGYVHFAYAALLVLGLASLFWVRARVPYLILISIALLGLPTQACLVSHDYLYCDAP